jgi:glycosyltransferase involved in cell wall biosynthesis
MVSEGLRVLVISYNRVAFSNFLISYVEKHRYKVVFLSDGYFNFLKEIPSLLRGKKFDLILTQHPLVLVITSLFMVRNNLRWIHFVTGQVWIDKPIIVADLYEFLDRQFSKSPSSLVFDSFGQYEFITSKWGEWPSMIYTGIGSMGGCDHYEFLTSPSQLKFCWIGRDVPNKDLKTTLDAFLKLKNNNSEAELYIFGVDGIDIPDMGIFYFGYVDNVIEIVSQLNIGVNIVSSHREGFCMVILEMAALGVPTISTRIYGSSEIVKNTSVEEYTFDVLSSSQLTFSMKKITLLNDNRYLKLRKKVYEGALMYEKNKIIKKFELEVL